MRRAAKVDGNQKAITEALRRAGWAVKPTHMIGQGWPDLVTARDTITGPINLLVECKMPGEKLTPDEQEFWDWWPGPKEIVYGPQDAVDKAAGWMRA